MFEIAFPTTVVFSPGLSQLTIMILKLVMFSDLVTNLAVRLMTLYLQIPLTIAVYLVSGFRSENLNVNGFLIRTSFSMMATGSSRSSPSYRRQT